MTLTLIFSFFARFSSLDDVLDEHVFDPKFRDESEFDFKSTLVLELASEDDACCGTIPLFDTVKVSIFPSIVGSFGVSSVVENEETFE